MADGVAQVNRFKISNPSRSRLILASILPRKEADGQDVLWEVRSIVKGEGEKLKR
jgi:hypothetical protein